jgi:chondroitin 4-sulfotransferase 11
MINHIDKIVFIHIPKTAGSSIYHFFNSTDYNHKTLQEHQGWTSDYFKFTFIRNPLDRFVSAYSYFKKYGRDKLNDVKMGKVINEFDSFKHFVQNFESIQHRFISRHFLPQTYWLDNRLDYIGRFESIGTDFANICKKINIKYKPLYLINNSEHKYFMDYYDSETYDIITKHYKIDFETFKYDF